MAFHGKQYKGAMRDQRGAKRDEAEHRQSRVRPERTRRHRLNSTTKKG